MEKVASRFASVAHDPPLLQDVVQWAQPRLPVADFPLDVRRNSKTTEILAHVPLHVPCHLAGGVPVHDVRDVTRHHAEIAIEVLVSVPLPMPEV